MPVISVRNLKKTYVVGDIQVHALRGVDVDVEAGEFLCVTGPSGSGKSTFMHILGCLDRPTSGQYILDGHDVSTMARDDLARVRNHRIGFVFQGFNLLSRTSAIENVELPLLYSRDHIKASDRHARSRAALEIVGLLERSHHHPNQLSGGQQQRVAIARALINRPAVLLADEPTGNLDSVAGRELLQLLGELHAEQGVTILLATHSDDAAAAARRVLHLKDGAFVGALAGPTPR